MDLTIMILLFTKDGMVIFKVWMHMYLKFLIKSLPRRNQIEL